MAHHDIQVSDLIYKIRLAADQQGATLRTSDTSDLIPLINDAYGRYVAQASGVGWPYFLNSVGGTVPVGRSSDATGDLPYGTIVQVILTNLKTEGIYKLEIRLPSGEWFQLEPIEFNQVNLYQSGYNPTQNGVPACYFPIGAPGDSGGPNTGINVGIVPPSDSGYTYRLWFASVQQAQATTDYLNIGVIGGDWWIVWDVAETLAIRDHYPDQAQLAAQKKQGVFAELCTRVNSRNKNSAFRVKDTRGYRRTRGLRQWPWGY